MPSASSVAGVAALVALAAQPWAGSTCPATSGDGATDDTTALQCLFEEGAVDEAVYLQKGATYLISRTLFPKKRKIYGGADTQGTMTTVRCKKDWGFTAFNVTSDLEVYGVHLDKCQTGFVSTHSLVLVDSTISNTRYTAVKVLGNDLTLVDSTIHNSDEAVFVQGVLEGGPLGVFLRRSKILSSQHIVVSVKGARVHFVMEGSAIAHGNGHGVVLDHASGGLFELHSSKISACQGSAIVVTGSRRTSTLVAEGSSVEGSLGPGISLLGGGGHNVSVVGGSKIQGGDSGILLRDTLSSLAVLRGQSSIHGTHNAIVLESGSGNKVALEDNSWIRSSLVNGVKVAGGNGHKVKLSGHSAIVDSGSSAIRVEAGHGHVVTITGGSRLRSSGLHGVLLAARGSVLNLVDAAVQESRGSAVNVTLSAARPTFSNAAGPFTRWWESDYIVVKLWNVYLVRNGYGFHCERASTMTNISGTLYLNDVDFDNRCTGKLSREGPLLGMAEFGALKAGVLQRSLAVAASAGSLPWWRLCCGPRGLPRGRLALPVLGAAAVVLLAGTACAWAASMLGLWRVMQALEREDLAKEGIGLLFALACALAACAPPASFAASQWWRKRRQNAEVLELLHALEAALWQGRAEEVQLLCARLAERGLGPAEIQRRVRELRRQQSLEAGVSVAYLLSPDFLDLARARTGLENPTFLQMKDPFWSGEGAIGKGVPCPRDGRPGCALVDTLHPRHRQRCTHFLSWVWRYPVLLVREALEIWMEEEGLDPSQTFLFMCFFVNNQFRILVEGTQAGSDNLETTFERNLQRIGRLVALLDHWRQPLYLSRIWTIYEQYVAAKLRLPVTVILDRNAGESLMHELDKGKDGVVRITGTFCSIRAEMAEASVKADEEHVKAMIRNTTGFDYVDQRVRHSMIRWVSSVVRQHMDILVTSADVGRAAPELRERVQRVSCTRLDGGAASTAVLEVEGSS